MATPLRLSNPAAGTVREFGGDPDKAKLRSAKTIENYEQ